MPRNEFRAHLFRRAAEIIRPKPGEAELETALEVRRRLNAIRADLEALDVVVGFVIDDCKARLG